MNLESRQEALQRNSADKSIGQCTLDIDTESLPSQVWCVEIATIRKRNPGDCSSEELNYGDHIVLVLERTSVERKEFRRLGIGTIGKSRKRNESPFKGADEEIISII
jgi:hypothetical protein